MKTTDDGRPSFANGGVELRFASGSYQEPGRAVVWIRLRVPVLPGDTIYVRERLF